MGESSRPRLRQVSVGMLGCGALPPAVLAPDRLDAGAPWQFWYPIYTLRSQRTCTGQLWHTGFAQDAREDQDQE
eukprot:9484060-Pyramimonas_sp.AAC.1